MRLFKFFWNTHKWTGIILSVVLANIAVSGFLLLIKKDYDWIQPTTQSGVQGSPEDFLCIDQVLERTYATGHQAFRWIDDIDRIDFRPGKRVHKIHSKHDHWEIQVDAVNGAILSTATRTSDWLEQLHDGSLFGAWVHDWAMPAVPFGLLFMIGSGLFLWLAPKWRRQRNKRARAT
jgi:uncharacterized iron-regulated membrane protein